VWAVLVPNMSVNVTGTTLQGVKQFMIALENENVLCAVRNEHYYVIK
jgi:hypothetical protein